ncbi:unnamed protein product, partial [Closterium sp. NIES-64]
LALSSRTPAPHYSTSTSPLSYTTPLCPVSPSPPLPPGTIRTLLSVLPPSLLHPFPPSGQMLGARSAPTAFRKDPGLLFIGIDEYVEPWICALCNFVSGPALDSAMAHLASKPHATNLRAAAKGPAVKEKYSNWRALTVITL